MQKYIDQLIEEIEAACKPIDRNKEPVSLQHHFKEIEKLIATGEPENEFSFYCGLKEEQFPSPDLLTYRQVKAVFKALCKLVLSWHISVLIPKTVPLRESYSLLITTLSRKVFIVEFGSVVIDFCTVDPKCCPLNKYCLCRKRKGKGKVEEEVEDNKHSLN